MTIPDETKGDKKTCSQCGSFGEEIILSYKHNNFFLCSECYYENEKFIESDRCPNFSDKDFIPCIEYMNSYFMYMLQCVRTITGFPFIVIAGFATKGHSKNSWHYKGMALDFWVKGLSALVAFRLLDRYWMGGLGIYPFRKIINVHADAGAKRRWWQAKDGEIIYESNPRYSEIWGILIEKELVNHGGVTEVK